jgi:hypothetical protein
MHRDWYMLVVMLKSTVSNLINVRQKNKQRMTWTRDGANQVLQIRTSKLSNKWDRD